MPAKILWIERGRPSPDFLPGLRLRGYQVTIAQSGKEALALVPALRPDLLVVQAAAMRTSGSRLCKLLGETRLPLLLIASPDLAPAQACTDQVLVLPFTLRKLVNRVKKMLGLPGGANGSSAQRLAHGPLVLDRQNRYALCNGARIDLTPRALRLLEMLMQHPGEVLDREHLYRTIWETNYTGDTRSLDVHISWIRRALGNHHQLLLKTIRGVGYRLDA